ncbi:LOW QUALITY PROTEIN: uncharacterized protein LOC128265203 [Drosophila gunungcola]|uniref:LOW QUALITY PROTEIN: uncharacterized protein LOC128265203 n=1 Tax=Drosophila gunungcola TaxID=103775 RepID=UPI0022E4ED09|nr:LOW QUALITY PROTEIN: uncharacterized protein LOC128265203 [Drosophila gunungcola]
MRLSKGYRTLSPASKAAQTPTLSYNSETSLSLLRLLAIVSLIGTQAHVICTESVEQKAASASTNIKIGENSTLLFDDYNKTKTTLSTAGYLSATRATLYAFSSQNQDQSQMTVKASNSSLSAIPTKKSRDKKPMETPGGFDTSNSPLIKKLTDITWRLGTTDQLPTVTMPTTSFASLKVDRSTIKQPIDSTRTRNHWTASGFARVTERPRSKHHHEHHWGPFFEEPLSSAASGDNLISAVHLFTEAVLNCRVGMLKDKTVMWVRRTAEKVSLLTVGNVTYSGDPRIRVKFQYPNNWRLLINPTQTEDAGVYMCQVSTHPPRVFTTNLTILEPPLRIIDEHERDVGDRYYKSGSTVDLQCQISRSFFQKERHTILKSTDSVNDSLQKLFNDTTSELYLIGNTSRTQHKFSGQDLEKYFLKFITWAKDEEPLLGLTNTRLSVSDVWLTSRISIGEAKLSDSGNYSCSLGRLFTVIVQVQVLTGELPAAVQHNVASRLDICSLAPLGLLIGLLFLSNFLQTERR